MDLTVFLIGSLFFTAGFIFILIQLYRKKSLLIPFISMGAGVIFCLIGLMLASPLEEDETDVRASLTTVTSPKL
ncbi:hypothetical protein [Salsuginibacillus kocurii]|uniref:hypothetical protein n=1 Tax=Salsuginibacillus kocurii TaxID=427078 RepID=UPI000381AF0F|nr:hypothetical protein [Salsuginibacillus kocurii]